LAQEYEFEAEDDAEDEVYEDDEEEHEVRSCAQPPDPGRG
jgi:hypothetical protein